MLQSHPFAYNYDLAPESTLLSSTSTESFVNVETFNSKQHRCAVGGKLQQLARERRVPSCASVFAKSFASAEPASHTKSMRDDGTKLSDVHVCRGHEIVE